jgi:hypothetical protein
VSARATGLDSPWVQAGLAAVLSVGVVASVMWWRRPPVEATGGLAGIDVDREDGALLFSTERPRGLLDLESLLYLLRPGELAQEPWFAGQFAEYELALGAAGPDAVRPESPTEPRLAVGATRPLRIEVLREARADDAHLLRYGQPYPDLYWLRLRSIHSFREHRTDVYRLANPLDLRITQSLPAVSFQAGYIPLVAAHGALPPEAELELREVAGETLALAGDAFDSRRFELYLHFAGESADVAEEWVGTLWHHPRAGPLGIVRLHSTTDALELRSAGVADFEPLEPEIAPLVEGQSTLGDFCHACHGETYHERIYPPH